MPELFCFCTELLGKYCLIQQSQFAKTERVAGIGPSIGLARYAAAHCFPATLQLHRSVRNRVRIQGRIAFSAARLVLCPPENAIQYSYHRRRLRARVPRMHTLDTDLNVASHVLHCCKNSSNPRQPRKTQNAPRYKIGLLAKRDPRASLLPSSPSAITNILEEMVIEWL